MITQEELKIYARYDPKTGIMTRNFISKYHPNLPKEISGKESSGYVVTKIKKKSYKIHRLAFLYMTGEIPDFVDHINGVRDDNRWCNLRAASKISNAQNMGLPKHNTSGIKGVYHLKKYGTWMVTIRVNKNPMYFGCYKDIEAAELVAILAREKYHGEFANHGV